MPSIPPSRAVARRGRVAVDQRAQLGARQRARLAREARRRDRRRRDGRRPRRRRDLLAAAVEELHEQPRVVLVDGVGERAVAGTIAGRKPPSVCEVSRPDRVDRRRLEEDRRRRRRARAPRDRRRGPPSAGGRGRGSVWCDVETTRLRSRTGPRSSGVNSTPGNLFGRDPRGERRRQRSCSSTHSPSWRPSVNCSSSPATRKTALSSSVPGRSMICDEREPGRLAPPRSDA